MFETDCKKSDEEKCANKNNKVKDRLILIKIK
jgi:hypothetical protein